MIEEGITARLTDDAAMSLLIAGRVFALLAPQGVRAPYVVFQKVATSQGSTYCASDDIESTMWQFDSYDKSFKGAKLVAKALRAALVDFHGLMDDTRIKTIKLETETDLLDPDPGLYRVLTTLIIWNEVT